jgi:hypothetical protein
VKLEKEDLTYKQETSELDQYETHFKAKLYNFEQELSEIDSLQLYLIEAKKHLDSTVSKKL